MTNPTRKAPGLASWLPQGMRLQPAVWASRHRAVIAITLAHVPFLIGFGFAMGWQARYALLEPLGIAALSCLSIWSRPGERARASIAAVAAVLTSAVLVQFSGGYIEAHFHFFIMVALIAAYQDWAPFAVAVAFVAFDHGVLGMLAPAWVYNHHDAVESPWTWAGIHAIMVLGQCAALLLLWRGVERERARSEVVLEAAAEGILGLNRDGTVQFVNPAGAQILGRPGHALLHKPFPALVGSSGPWGEARGPLQGEALLQVDETEVPVQWVAQRGAATPSGVDWVVTLQDLTERRRQERERLEQLVEQDRFKTQLLNTASHELNTPISVLRLQLDLLGREPGLPPSAAQKLDLLRRNVARLGTLVQQTLDVARIQGGRLTLDLGQVDVAEIVEEACASFEYAARSKKVRLSWSCPRGLVVRGDGPRLGQVMYNLVANAVKFTPAGGTIEVRAAREGQMVRVQVADSGIGIAPADQKALFRPFSQVRGAQMPGGTGLGLYISKTILEAHGGAASVASAGLGLGATFTVDVPVAGPSVSFAAEGREAQASTSGAILAS